MSFDQASTSSLSQSSFQPFDSLPDEVLLLLLDQLTPFQRCLVLSICRKWNHTILQRKSWWQYVDIPYHLPFSTALSILQSFNSRSSFTLRHVILELLITTYEELDEVLAELNKSSGHLKLLFLNQSRSMLKARRAVQKLLPKLNTFYGTFSHNVETHLKAMWSERDRARVLDKEEQGLQIFHISKLGDLGVDDLEWFSKLKYLGVKYTNSIKDLRIVLKGARATLRRLKLNSWEFNENLEELDPIHTDDSKRIDLPNLTVLYTPMSEVSAAALSNVIEVEGHEKRLFFGLVHSLLHFDFPSLKQARFCTYDSNALEKAGLDEEKSKLKTVLFFERNPSICHLILDHVSRFQDGGSFHLNFILQSLSIRNNYGNLDESEKEPEKVLLSEFQKLTIYSPKTLDKKLLKQLWETRKAIQEDFEIQVRIEGKAFSIDRSGGEEWLDEANCE